MGRVWLAPTAMWDGALGPIEVRRIQPYQALKAYICPGCNRDIPERTGHYVAVPTQEPDLRRHWHYSCWDRRTPSKSIT
ncbi:MAG: hypothetical protein WCG65_04905 [Actinomycetes bacterium]